MEELQKAHRKQQRDLQSQITQKKKNSTKKTRKSVNDECEELERRLKERQAEELAALNGDVKQEEAHELGADVNGTDIDVEPEADQAHELTQPLKSLQISPDPPAQNESNKKKPNRQKARLARRAAEQEALIEQAEKEAADLPNLRAKEMEAMRSAAQTHSLSEHEIRSDGHCLYAAIADQLSSRELGLQPSNHSEQVDAKQPGYKTTRAIAASYISTHPDDFVPFLEEPLDQHVKTVRETGEWGGHLELVALAKAYNIDVKVLHASGQVDQIESGAESARDTLWLAYYKHSFGLGEHYNSLRPG